MIVELLPIQELLEENTKFVNHPDCQESLSMTIDYYKIIGFHQPWICYYASINNELVGAAGFKGRPVNNKIEIAYGTFPSFMNQGIGTAICKALVLLAQKTDPSVIITARTLPEINYSTKILEKNNFKFIGNVWDKDDGDVWEWEYQTDKM